MSVQGGNAIDHAQAYAGMLADLQLSNLVSKLNASGSDILFGLGVISDGEDGAQLGGGAQTAANFVGVTHRDVNYVVPADGVGQENTARSMSVVTEGVIWVSVTGSTAKDDDVYLLDDGTFANAGAVQIAGAKFLGADSAGISKVSLGLGG